MNFKELWVIGLIPFTLYQKLYQKFQHQSYYCWIGFSFGLSIKTKSYDDLIALQYSDLRENGIFINIFKSFQFYTLDKKPNNNLLESKFCFCIIYFRIIAQNVKQIAMQQKQHKPKINMKILCQQKSILYQFKILIINGNFQNNELIFMSIAFMCRLVPSLHFQEIVQLNIMELSNTFIQSVLNSKMPFSGQGFQIQRENSRTDEMFLYLIGIHYLISHLPFSKQMLNIYAKFVVILACQFCECKGLAGYNGLNFQVLFFFIFAYYYIDIAFGNIFFCVSNFPKYKRITIKLI
ncbi:unnamed protein product (macronuclear) [Paramecium tetraurelia]|uniref:Transmembrane protein n=1 Tax=Paramecium tetraurelia TaxID=5888 RepID=A0E5T8_PARTE|nr:uncharacterized protein GSPATT00003517001 [Paramecium tetraurelia]CAK90655.1 unnamed protein product [Paramecium tetraurelia]|eukprot:XP_001458052.1 hypothetical protein (macronuclear) [Paramecium tetraurelia strain d4-2]